MQSQMININNSSFNKQLLEMLCDSDDETEEKPQDTHCLISNNILEEKCIKLSCGHKFNYYSIFHEIKNQKTVHNSKEVQYLQLSQIKCPYCRHVQKGLLPDRENFPKIRGVNWPKSLQFMPNSCEYIFLSGKKKHTACNKKCHGKYCPVHQKIMEKRLNKANNKLKITDISKNKTHTTCSYMFKKGKNKGKCCPTKLFKNGFCKTHYKKYCSQKNNENICPKIDLITTNYII